MARVAHAQVRRALELANGAVALDALCKVCGSLCPQRVEAHTARDNAETHDSKGARRVSKGDLPVSQGYNALASEEMKCFPLIIVPESRAFITHLGESCLKIG